MFQLMPIQAVDYLVIGHLTCDLTPDGPRLGGTAAYSARMAHALGLRVGIVTSWGGEFPLDMLADIPIVSFPAERSTTFEIEFTPDGRQFVLRSLAPSLDYYQIPQAWRSAPIVHLGPIADEVEPGLVRNFPSALLGVTPQGWLRSWDASGRVFPSEWPEADFVLQRAGAAVISVEDVQGDESRIDEMAASCRVLAVTEADAGARIYWNGDVRRFRSPLVREVDAVGAGDVFAACFFTRLYATRDPWEAARFATQLAAISVTRPGLEGIPSPEEIQSILVEIR